MLSTCMMKCRLIAELLSILRLYDPTDKSKNPAVLYMMGVRNKSCLKSASLSMCNKVGVAKLPKLLQIE